MAPHSSTLAWKIPWTEEPGGCSPWGRQELDTTELFTFTFHFHALEKEMATHSSVLPGVSQGRGSLVGCCLWSHTESDMTEATQQQQHKGVQSASEVTLVLGSASVALGQDSTHVKWIKEKRKIGWFSQEFRSHQCPCQNLNLTLFSRHHLPGQRDWFQSQLKKLWNGTSPGVQQ